MNQNINVMIRRLLRSGKVRIYFVRSHKIESYSIVTNDSNDQLSDQEGCWKASFFNELGDYSKVTCALIKLKNIRIPLTVVKCCPIIAQNGSAKSG